MNNEKEIQESPPVFHIYNRANDRGTLFQTHSHYLCFMAKMRSNFAGSAILLGYCLMPNHFHILLSPKHPVELELSLTDRPLRRMPTDAISESVRRLLMGFTKGYNKSHGLTGSRFQQRTRCKYHYNSLHYGLKYLHFNPVKAKLVDDPGSWPYSSYLEYAGFIEEDKRICHLSVGRKLLHAGILE